MTPPRKDRELSGQKFDAYQVETVLRSRRGSCLYLAHDVKRDQTVYLEVLNKTADKEKDLTDRFLRRLETMAQFDHPNIAPLVDWGVSSDRHAFAVVDFASEETLASRLRGQQPASPAFMPLESLSIVRQLGLALSVAHPAGLFHHDLRPENIFLKDGCTPVLIDLGLPIQPLKSALASPEALTETLDYASPEQLSGKMLTGRSNVFSLGVILYELLAGKQPELPISSWDIFERKRIPQEVPLEEIRPDLAPATYQLVRSCLWRQEWSRFETIDEFVAAVDRAIAAEEAESAPSGIGAPVLGNIPWRVVGAVASFLILMVVLFLLVSNRLADSSAAQATAAALNAAASGATATATPTMVVATPTRVPTATLLPLASAPAIGLVAPDASAQYDLDTPVTFTWSGLETLESDQAYFLYLYSGEEIFLTVRTDEAIDGTRYEVTLVAAGENIQAGAFEWEILLELEEAGTVLQGSQRRPIVFVEATPTPTNTPAPTMTATETPSATPTATRECVPSPPSSWVLYTVEAGDRLFNLAQAANVTVETVIQINCLESTALSIGQRVWVPAASIPTSTPEPTATPVPSSGGGGGGGGGGDSKPPRRRPTSTPPP